MNLGQYLVQQLLEDNIQEVYPKRSSDDINQNYVTKKEHWIEKAAADFNYPIPDVRFAFIAGSMVVLTDEIWSKLENQDLKDDLEFDGPAMILNYDDDKYYLVYGGNLLRKHKELNKIPKILMGKLNVKGPKPFSLKENFNDYEIIEKIIKGFNLIPFKQGFKNSYTTTKGKATKNLARKIYNWVNNNFPYNKIQIQYEATYGTINLNIKDDNTSKTLKEGLDKDILNKFLKFVVKELDLKQLPSKVTLSKDVKKARTKHTFGTFAPDSNAIWLYINNRNTADILRTLAHELVHRKQEEDGRLEPNSGETGSEIENEANAQAGVLLRKFGEQNPMIYEGLIKEGIYGDYLFGDKNTGAAIKWYKDEIEPDTPAEKSLFNLLKKYANSEYSTYSAISLDDFIPVFKKLKKQYPEIVDPKLSSDKYIYRGTSLPKEQINRLVNSEAENIIDYEQGYIIPNQTYQSKRKIQSWSTNYFIASGFAFTSAAKKEEVPIIIRAKVSDADLYFKPEFVDKLSTQSEDETFNIINPIPADIMVMEFYEDEFEDIEAGYLHTKK